MPRQPPAPEHPCAFDLALLAGCAECHLAGQTHLGERILVGCRDSASSGRCGELLDRLRENAGFVFRRRGASAPPTHAEALRLRCGGLAGVARQVITDFDSDRVADIDVLAERIWQTPGGPDALAWDRVVREIAACRPPGRRRR